MSNELNPHYTNYDDAHSVLFALDRAPKEHAPAWPEAPRILAECDEE